MGKCGAWRLLWPPIFRRLAPLKRVAYSVSSSVCHNVHWASLGIRLVGPMKSTLIGTLEPVTAAVVSAAWLGTAFHPVELAGFVCILATVFLIVVQWPSR